MRFGKRFLNSAPRSPRPVRQPCLAHHHHARDRSARRRRRENCFGLLVSRLLLVWRCKLISARVYVAALRDFRTRLQERRLYV